MVDNPASAQAFGHKEPIEHREPQNNKHTLKEDKLSRSIHCLCLMLKIREKNLVQNYLTQDDLDDIAAGMYDHKLPALAALIRGAPGFPFDQPD